MVENAHKVVNISQNHKIAITVNNLITAYAENKNKKNNRTVELDCENKAFLLRLV